MPRGAYTDVRNPKANAKATKHNEAYTRLSGAHMVEVVAALIRQNGKFLICQRPAHKARGLMWEFVGGKVEAGETGEDALVRECREELDICISVGEVFTEVRHKYPDITVHLTVFEAEIESGEPKLLEHAAIKWITAEDIKYYNFCPADDKILKKIREQSSDGRARKRLGADGEELAAKYLKKHGWTILERGYVTPYCEVDIIARRKDILSFCEVKTRNTDTFGRPSEAVDKKKRERYIRAAKSYTRGKEDFTVRFDIIEIYRGEINFIENAFYSE